MPFEIIVQTSGQRILQCRCGFVTVFRVRPQSHRVKCRNRDCHRTYVLGTVVFEVTSAPRYRPPADLAIPYDPAEVGNPIDASSFGNVDEVTIAGGKWRSAEPVTIDMPRELTEEWEDSRTGQLWRARRVAFGTRYVARPGPAILVDPADVDGLVLIDAAEWRKWMIRKDLQPAEKPLDSPDESE